MPNKVKALLVAVIAGGASILGWVFLRHHAKVQDAVNSATMLQPTEDEAIIINPIHRNIIIVRPTGTTTLDLPDRPSRVSILKTGKIWVAAPQWGAEARPFVAVGYNLNSGVVGGGLSVFYYKRLDLDLGLMFNPSLIQSANVFIGFSVFAYSNTSIGLGVDNSKRGLLFISVRL